MRPFPVARLAVLRLSIALRSILLLALLLLAGCKGAVPQPGAQSTPAGSSAGPTATPGLPVELAEGKALYRTYCQSCHGVDAAGSEMGPPLVHAYYGPSVHSDEDIANSVLNGTKQNRWEFGDMLPVAGVEMPQIGEITRYVRYLQQRSGIP